MFRGYLKCILLATVGILAAGPVMADPSGIVSDDFNECQLNPALWQFVNPLGDASVRVTGIGTNDAVAEIVLPAGPSHDPWWTGNDAPRLMQPAANTDLTVEAKFDSVVTTGYQMQGIIVEQSANYFLRYEIHHNGGGVNLYAAILNGPAVTLQAYTSILPGSPLWLRVQRTGDLWLLTYSYNGTDWQLATGFSDPMQVTAVGPFAGNYGSGGNAPAFTCRVDYFFNAAEPIVPEDGPPVGNPGTTLQTAVTGSGLIQVSPQQSVYYCGETVAVTAVPDPGWVFSNWSGDLTGSQSPQALVMSQSRSITANFEPDTQPLQIINVVVKPSDNRAIVTWQTNKPATSVVAYGPTAAYELGTLQDSALVVTHSMILPGLVPLREYHLQVTSVDATTVSVSSQDIMFYTTYPGGVVSDDFNTCQVNPYLWQFVNPTGDAIARLSGVGTNDAVAEIVLPAGASHDPWTSGNFAPRLMQAVADTNFVIEAKFDSVVTAGYQMQGLIVEQSNDHFLRYEVLHNGAGPYVYAAIIANGSATTKTYTPVLQGVSIWLRVQRQDEAWTLGYSYDGLVWHTAVSFLEEMTVAAVGPFAGNYSAIGAAPAFTARVDYVFNTAVPIYPEDGVLFGNPAVLETAVTGAGLIQASPWREVYYCGETINITAVPFPGWSFSGWSGDLSGSQSQKSLEMSQSRFIHATFVQGGPALQIENLSVAPAETTAVVTWQTNQPASSIVAYGQTTAYELGTVTDNTLVTSHIVTLTDLTPGATYHLQATSVDGSSASVSSEDVTFSTIASSSGIVSDDFNVCQLNASVWQFVNPLNDASVQLTGMGTNDAIAEIILPAGASHDLAPGSNHAPRLMQASADTDFTVEAKFDSAVTQGFQIQGLAIEETQDHYLRYEVYYNGGATIVYAAVMANGLTITKASTPIAATSPIWLRVQRQGDLWTMVYSLNGTDWLASATFTEIMQVSAVGPYAGNFAPAIAPAFTCRVDYFFNVASPLNPEDGVPAGNPGFALQTAVTGSGSIQVDPQQSVYYCGETVAVTAVPDPGWVFVGWSGDLTGSQAQQNVVMSQARSIHATFEPDTSPPQITKLSVAPSGTTALVTWQTNKPATSAVAYGPSTAYELGMVQSGALVTSHSVTLSGLTPLQSYHLQATSVDHSNASVNSPDVPFNTILPGGFVSDDFNSFNLNQTTWTIVNPLQNATFAITGTNTADARLEISIPGGITQALWNAEKSAPRVMQAAANTDFAVQAKFESVMTQGFQEQGIIVEEDADTYLRLEFYSNGSGVFVFAARSDGGSSTVLENIPAISGFPLHMRITRAGDNWTQEYGFDGVNWNPAASFQHPMTVTAVGVYIGSEVGLPAFTGKIDYFFNTAAPIVPEDGTVVVDTTPPVITVLEPSVSDTTATINWTTDEPANSAVDYGLTTAYELGTVSSGTFSLNHSLTLQGLSPQTTYHIRIRSSDSSQNEGHAEGTVATAPAGTAAGPEITVWYGDTQEFGKVGMPMPLINITGHAGDPDGLASMSYSLNGGPWKNLSITPQQSPRLGRPGDFNVELEIDTMPLGPNDLKIRAFDGLGNQTLKQVNVINSKGPVWPLPYSIDWSQVNALTDVSQPIDGLWNVQGDGVESPQEMAYDRLLAIGDRTWGDYEATVTLDVHALNPGGFTYPSNGALFGLIMHWPGHTDWGGGDQPRLGFWPLGGAGWFRWTDPAGAGQWQIYGSYGIVMDARNEALVPPFQRRFRMRVETGATTTTYSLKYWDPAVAEPAAWSMVAPQSNTIDPGTGCLVLIAHQASVTFRDVEVVPGPFSAPLSAVQSAGDSEVPAAAGTARKNQNAAAGGPLPRPAASDRKSARPERQ